jgi:hypothetical protein
LSLLLLLLLQCQIHMELYHNTKLSFPVQHLAVEHLSSSFFLVFGF